MDGDRRAALQAEMFANRVMKNARSLRRWVVREGITCYRVYDRDIPEVPFVVDWYDGRLHVAEYARRRTAAMTDEEHRGWTGVLVAAVADALHVDASKVFVKSREPQRGPRQYERLASDGVTATVVEGGLRFEINLTDYLDTGLFLDHRITRNVVREVSRDKSVLNLFGYTGAFSVYAAAGGARSTVTVDMSRTYLDWARRNFRLNGIHAGSGTHLFVRDEARSFLAARARRGERWDIVVVDPPTFSNSKRMQRDFDVQRDHAGLLESTLGALAPGGVVYFSTSFRGFRLDAALTERCDVDDVSDATIPRDFRDRKVHRCFTIRRRRRPLA